MRYDLIAARVHDPAEDQLPAFAGLLPARDPESGRQFWLDTDSFFARRSFAKGRRQRFESLLRSLRRLKIDWFDASTEGDFTGNLVKFFRQREKRVRR